MCLRGRYGSAKKSIFSSEFTEPYDDTMRKLKNLHPVENFCWPKPKICKLWTDAPINSSEVQTAINHLPKGKAAVSSGISFDILKSACRKAPEICDDLAEYFQNMVCLNTIPPTELVAARLIALVKPGNGKKPDGIRPIAIGKSITRLFASIVFYRVASKAAKFLAPFQFGIRTIDGASVAALTSVLFFSSNNQNYIFDLDFKNAFNSVHRSAVYDVTHKEFSELSSYFYLFYGKTSELIYGSYTLFSCSAVKQGDPLGPLLFCLAIHKSLIHCSNRFPMLKIVGYLDDNSIIGPSNVLNEIASEASLFYRDIGLLLNADKCLLIGKVEDRLTIDGVEIPFLDYSSDAFRFLGWCLGNVPKIIEELNNFFDEIGL
ncbi:hypothetical protein P9112_008088 [Eukaryota sp. TZLM1-RC]